MSDVNNRVTARIRTQCILRSSGGDGSPPAPARRLRRPVAWSGGLLLYGLLLGCASEADRAPEPEGGEGEGAALPADLGVGEGEGEGEGHQPDGGAPPDGGSSTCAPLADETTPRVAVQFDPAGHFFHRPFPDDSRRDATGHLELTGFPNPGQSGLLNELVALTARENTGWSINGTIYLSFSGPLHPDSWSVDPAATLAPDAPFFLAELDEQGRLGEPIPLVVRYRDAATLFLPEHTLAVYPVPGFVLRDGVRHALVVTSRLRDLACRPLLPPTGAFLEQLTRQGLIRPDLAGAAIFTTLEVIEPMRRLRAAVEAQRVQLPELRLKRSNSFSEIYEGAIRLPNFQAGEPPYLAAGSGGHIVWNEAGEPQVQKLEQVRVALAVPRAAGTMPENGWPVLLYAHGTGGDFETVLQEGVAGELNKRGLAALGYDQVLHGPRDPTGSPPELTFFNVFNMVAGRDNVRQGGVDAFVLQQLASRLSIPAAQSPSGQPVLLDPERFVFMGHSQGGITGAPFVAVADGVQAAVFSGTSGSLRITILERADLEAAVIPGVTTYQELVEKLLNIAGREELDMFHPVLTLMQTFIDPADTLSYAPYFHRLRKPNQRVPILILEGFLDPMAPAIGAEAFAVAVGADLVQPIGRTILGLELRGREVLDPPVEANWDGITAGISQYPRDGHFALFDNAAAQRRTYGFLGSSVTREQPVIP